MKEWTEEAYARLQVYVTESLRLARLTDAELVREAVERRLVDDPLIEEMATRIDPEWTRREWEDK